MSISKRTFFEYLGIADMEKIHSQVLKWIFHTDNEAISENQKHTLLADIFGVSNFQRTDIITEYENIDIVIKSENQIICIENKIKSSQHSNQLKKYKENIDLAHSSKIKHYFYLTLIEENSFINEWKNITYSLILKKLSKLKIEPNNDGVILKEYIRTLKNLNDTLTSFILNPEKYLNVFKEANKTKKEKQMTLNQKTLSEKFISQNQLETIFQKLYFNTIAKKLNLQDICYITETRGNAIFGIIIEDKISIDNKEYQFGFDYQNGTFKTYFNSQEYQKSKKEDLPKEIPLIFSNLVDQVEYGYKKANKPRTKAYFSITKSRKDCIGMNIEKFSKIYKEELDISRRMVKNELMIKIRLLTKPMRNKG